MKKICAFIGKYFGLFAVLFLVLGLTLPAEFKWVTGQVGGVAILSLLLGVVMFGMGMTLNLSDFALVLKRPGDIAVGALAQFLIMPSLAFGIATMFDLSPALTAGVILVGTCPGGTASNVITFMAKGDLALSVAMTSVSTLLAPILTPFITYQLIGEKISFDPIGMFWSIVQIVIIPICLGLAVKAAFPVFAEESLSYTPAVSGIAISLIIAGVIASSRDNILQTSGTILLVVMLHNVLGYMLGFTVARMVGMSWRKAIALSIEVGMQNSGLATGLAKTHFAAMPMATVPGAIFSAWHNISGALLALLFENYLTPKYGDEADKSKLTDVSLF
ncbi:MAG: bile acid:sodium symporter family protein [Acidaminococcaceae bacterium]